MIFLAAQHFVQPARLARSACRRLTLTVKTYEKI